MIEKRKMNIVHVGRYSPLPQLQKRNAALIPRFKDLIITHKFLEPPVERVAKAEIMHCPFNATWLVTIARKNVPKDMGNDKFKDRGFPAPVV